MHAAAVRAVNPKPIVDGWVAAALARVAGPEVSALIDWSPDPDVARIVASWPARVRAGRAARLGLTPDPDFDSIIRMHMAESGPGGNGSR